MSICGDSLPYVEKGKDDQGRFGRTLNWRIICGNDNCPMKLRTPTQTTRDEAVKIWNTGEVLDK